MCLDQLLRNRQAQTGALSQAASCGSNLVKLVENRRLLFNWNSNSSIADRNFGETLQRSRVNVNLPALQSELDRIAQQIVKDFLETNTIRMERELGRDR